MSEGKGKLAGRAKASHHKYDSNAGGEFAEGMLFKHMNCKKIVRYVRLNGKLVCSKCRMILE
jgi:hypothetical protein